jgi:hypothetical protein
MYVYTYITAQSPLKTGSLGDSSENMPFPLLEIGCNICKIARNQGSAKSNHRTFLFRVPAQALQKRGKLAQRNSTYNHRAENVDTVKLSVGVLQKRGKPAQRNVKSQAREYWHCQIVGGSFTKTRETSTTQCRTTGPRILALPNCRQC